MSKLDQLLSGDVPPAVYHFGSRAHAATVQQTITAHGWRCFYLDGAHISDKASFLRACATAMQFPAYFGHNWDALSDCMRDISDSPAPGYIMLYDDVANFAAHAPDEWAIAYAIFNEIVGLLRTEHTPLYVLLRGTARLVPDASKL